MKTILSQSFILYPLKSSEKGFDNFRNYRNAALAGNKFCVKSVCIWSFSGLYFLVFGQDTERYGVFGLNTKRCGVSLHINSKCKKTDQKKSEYGCFSRSGGVNLCRVKFFTSNNMIK